MGPSPRLQTQRAGFSTEAGSSSTPTLARIGIPAPVESPRRQKDFFSQRYGPCSFIGKRAPRTKAVAPAYPGRWTCPRSRKSGPRPGPSQGGERALSLSLAMVFCECGCGAVCGRPLSRAPSSWRNGWGFLGMSPMTNPWHAAGLTFRGLRPGVVRICESGVSPRADCCALDGHWT